MYIRNDGKGESNITQNGFTAYLLSAVAHRKADYLHAKQRRQAREVLTDPDDLSTEEAPGISDPTDLLCCIENAALEEALNRISERDRYIFFSRALHGRSFHELALELDLGYQGVAAAYSRREILSTFIACHFFVQASSISSPHRPLRYCSLNVIPGSSFIFCSLRRSASCQSSMPL